VGTVAFADGRLGQAVLMRSRHSRLSVPQSSFVGFRFPPEVITVAVRWYLRYGLSYRDVEELLAERDVEVDHVTLYRWMQRFTPLFLDAARPCRHRWFVDKTYVKVAGRWTYLYRAIDQFGQVIDVLAAEKRDLAAARRFFAQALEQAPRPSEVTTDRAPAYLWVLDESCRAPYMSSSSMRHGRSRSRPAEVPTPADAWAQDRLRSKDHHRWARVCPEHPQRTLRTRDGGTSELTGAGYLRRTGPGDLTDPRITISPVPASRNATAPSSIVCRAPTGSW
jgi:transposase-like protein